MTVMDSGMHVVYAWNALTWQKVVRHCFITHFVAPPPEGYGRFCPIPGEHAVGSENLQEALRAGDAGPEFSLPVQLTWERDDDSGVEDVDVVFGCDAFVDGDHVCVDIIYRSVSRDVEGLGAFLAARGPARWQISMDWLDVPGAGNLPVDAAVGIGTGPPEDRPQEDHLAVGVAIDGLPADPVRFRGGFEFEGGQAPKLAVSDGVMNRLLDLFVDDLLTREAAGERLFGLDALGYDYEVTDLTYNWRRRNPHGTAYGEIDFIATGSIFVLDDWRTMELSFRGNFLVQGSDSITGVPPYDWERSDWLLRTNIYANFPVNIHLPHHPELETSLAYPISPQPHRIVSADAYTPSAHIPFHPEEMGDFAMIDPTLFSDHVRIGLGAIEPEEYDLDRASIHVEPDEIRIEFTHHFVEPVRTCSGTLMPWNEGTNWAYLTISNPSDVPVSVELSSNNPSLIDFSADAFTLDPGDSRDVRLEVLTAHLPLYHDPDTDSEPYDAIVFIRHTACRFSPTIPVDVYVIVHFEHSHGHNLSDDAVEALCGFWDIMMIKRGFLSVRDDFVDLPDDRPDYLAAVNEIYVISLRDPRNQYEFVAQSPAGDVLAMDSSNALYKTLQLVVPPNESLSFDVRYRNSTDRVPQGPFHWVMRGLVVEPKATLGAEGIKAFAPSPHGLIAVGPSGITLVDTIDLRKPFSEAAIKNEDMLSDITSTQGMAFAVGGHKLLVLNLKTQKGVEVIATHKIAANATLIRQYGDRFWMACKEQLMWFKMEAPDKIEMVAATKLEASAIDIMAHKNGVVVLDKHGVTLYGLDEDKGLKLFCWMELDVEPDSVLLAGGVLTGITGRKQGSRFIDFSDVKSPQIVATYRDPHWFSGMTIDVTRNMTYRFDADKKLIDISMIRTRRIEKK